MNKAIDISQVLNGKKILVKTNFQVDVELTIRRIEPFTVHSKDGICLIFTNDTFEVFENIFALRFVE